MPIVEEFEDHPEWLHPEDGDQMEAMFIDYSLEKTLSSSGVVLTITQQDNPNKQLAFFMQVVKNFPRKNMLPEQIKLLTMDYGGNKAVYFGTERSRTPSLSNPNEIAGILDQEWAYGAPFHPGDVFTVTHTKGGYKPIVKRGRTTRQKVVKGVRKLFSKVKGK